jgi:KaiC/GvpD/RAD55 family RecA-like ATPase
VSELVSARLSDGDEAMSSTVTPPFSFVSLSNSSTALVEESVSPSARGVVPGGYALPKVRALPLAVDERYRLERVDLHALLSGDDPGIEWIIPDVIARGRAVALVAAPKTGKSLLTLSLVVDAVRNGFKVMYLDYEMSQFDLRDRLVSMGMTPDNITALDGLFYVSFPSLNKLNFENEAKALTDQATTVSADLVVIDTLSRVYDGKENDADTFNDFAKYTGNMMKKSNIAVLRLDHTGHDERNRARGSSVKQADVDATWILSKTDDGVKLKLSESRVPWMPQEVTYRKTEEPLRFEPVKASWPDGTRELAGELKQLGWNDGQTIADAQGLLKAENGEGRKKTLVAAAVRYLKTQA